MEIERAKFGHFWGDTVFFIACHFCKKT